MEGVGSVVKGLTAKKIRQQINFQVGYPNLEMNPQQTR